ncbi:uncharacterized protein METZ01_LOCUS154501 [marine metagenome]|uniref:Uncharacterized protein n=1 Tax=marine metagenome TaxID=408172 RepID=A0A382AKY6_9ZZZZ
MKVLPWESSLVIISPEMVISSPSGSDSEQALSRRATESKQIKCIVGLTLFFMVMNCNK